MAKFFVGQRVRMVDTDEPRAQPFVGKETRIIGEGYYDDLGVDAWDLANGWSVTKPDAGSYIEPILPYGHRVGEEGTCEPLDKLLSEVSRESTE
jgi:hypothetical protein